MQKFGVLVLLLALGCSQPESNPTTEATPEPVQVVEAEVNHATGFAVEYHKGYKKVTVFDPWNREVVLSTYILVQQGVEVEVLPGEIELEIPLSTMACQSTTHLPMMNAIGHATAVTGISHPALVSNETSRKLIDSGHITGIGGSNEIDAEKVIALNPDAVMVYPMEGLNYDNLRESGITLIYNSEYLEDTPLAQAEWIKFVALFFNAEEQANTVFAEIEREYKQLSNLVKNRTKPTVMAGISYQGIYYAPGGNSFNAQFIADAGATYVWNEIGDKGATELDMELVMEAGTVAEWWVFAANRAVNYNLTTHVESDTRFGKFNSVVNGKVLICNTSRVNYFEDALLEPHVILADLVSYFHPGVLPDHSPKYFQHLE